MSTPLALPDDAISLSEAARLLGVAPCSVWRWAVRDGRLRAWRVGARWRLSRAEVLGLVRANTPRPEVRELAEAQARTAESLRVLAEEGVR